VAGHFTPLEARITDTSVAERLAPCRPWVRALLAEMLPRVGLAALPTQRRFLVIDASGIQGPGARGTQYRLHLCMDMATLDFTSIAITDKRTGEHLTTSPLAGFPWTKMPSTPASGPSVTRTRCPSRL
jgi:hypothetical protein